MKKSLAEKVHDVKERLRKEFLFDTRPWVITFSGGKDSSTVLHLVISMLLDLKKEGISHSKKVYVVSSDTRVEMPLIEDYVSIKLERIRDFVQETQLNVEVNLLSPKVSESFWSMLLGKGYPSPNQTFRWCTERMKIRPATHFLQSLIHPDDPNRSSILMLLGVRSDESQSRAQSIEKRDENHRGFSTHSDIENAFIFSPIKDWTNAEVWTFLSENAAPWGEHTDMMKLYDKGSGEADCNIALNPEAASCGKTRFGCWVCTVVSQDKSMENMLRNPEDAWMLPLHEFRNKIEAYRNDHQHKRQPRRRNGQKSVGPYLLSVRQELLRSLLEIEQGLKDKLGSKTFISDEEIAQIQDYWLQDGDFFETAISIAGDFGRTIEYDSVKAFGAEDREYIKSLCDEENIDIELIEHIMQKEHSHRHQLKRTKLFSELEAVVENYATGKINAI